MKFKCSECNKKRDASDLSNFSLRLADTRDPETAILRLHPTNKVCIYCDEADTIDEPKFIHNPGRTYVEEWEFSGLTVDKPYWDRHRLNN